MKRIVAFVLAMVLYANAAWAANCTLSGTVLNVDGSACANCTITLNPVTAQPLTTGGTTYTSQPISTTTDANGVMTSISLPQGLIVNVTISENGATFGGYTAIVPFMSAATFTQMNQGIATNPLNVLASSQPPTGPLSMNSQKITNLACPGSTYDALVFGCDATVGNLTVNGGYTIGSGLSVTGRLTDAPLGAVSAPTVSTIGVTGGTSYTYYIVCHDGNVLSEGSVLSAGGSTSIGNATLTASNYNNISWTMPAGTLNCDVLRNDTTHSIALDVTTGTWKDQQAGAGSAYLPPTRNTTGLAGYAGAGTQGYFGTEAFFTTTVTYVTPAWAPSALRIKMAGGGGGGGAATSGVGGGGASNAGSGGGAGAQTDCYILAPSGGYTVTVGAAGAAGICAASPTDATGGGNTSFSSSTFCTAAGGAKGVTATGGGGGPAGGAGGAVVSTTTSTDQTSELLLAQAGNNGAAGANNAATPGAGGNGTGANGGAGATATAGACTGTATAGNAGWVLVEAIP